VTIVETEFTNATDNTTYVSSEEFEFADVNTNTTLNGGDKVIKYAIESKDYSTPLNFSSDGT
jgi:hypothetical protein